MARLRLRLSGDEGAPRPAGRRPRRHQRDARRRPPRSTRPIEGRVRPRPRTRSTSPSPSSSRACRSWSAATDRTSRGGWPPATPMSSTSTACPRPRSSRHSPSSRSRCEEIDRDPATLPVSVHIWRETIEAERPAERVDLLAGYREARRQPGDGPGRDRSGRTKPSSHWWPTPAPQGSTSPKALFLDR